MDRKISMLDLIMEQTYSRFPTQVRQFSEQLQINKEDKSERNILEITEKLNSIIEKMILNNPGDWIWTHNRWK